MDKQSCGHNAVKHMMRMLSAAATVGWIQIDRSAVRGAVIRDGRQLISN